MRRAGALVAVFFLAVIVGCSSATPVSIRVGDVCESCRRPIQNLKVAAEIVAPAGRLPLKFRTVSCMARYLKEHGDTQGEVFVTDYATDRLIQARSAVFVKSEIDPDTKELDYFAFGDVRKAVEFGKKSGGSATDWPAIRQRVAAGGN
jgi:nitrous oxide reductase accessory protein NosL